MNFVSRKAHVRNPESIPPVPARVRLAARPTQVFVGGFSVKELVAVAVLTLTTPRASRGHPRGRIHNLLVHRPLRGPLLVAPGPVAVTLVGGEVES